MKVRFSEKGASLIETLVAVGILGLIAYFVVGLLKTGTVGQKTLQAQDDARTLTEGMAALMSDQIACQKTFINVNPAASPATPILALKDANGADAYQAGIKKVYGNRSLELVSIKVGGGSETDQKSGIQLWTPKGTPPTAGSAFVEVTWKQTGAGTDNASGPSIMRRHFMLNVLSLIADPSGNLTISDCSAQAAGGTTFWTLNGDGNIYNSNNNGLGGVGIGTATPVGIFDVYTGSRHAITAISTGDIGIGTTTPAANLHLKATAPTLRLESDAGHFSMSAGDAASGFKIDDNAGTNRMQILASGEVRFPGGNVVIGATTPPILPLQVNGDVQAESFISLSDERLKSDIRTTEGLAKVLQLRGTQYHWRKDGTPGMGLIAQEVEKVYPEVVATNKGSGFKAISYSALLAPLIEAVKELYVMCRTALEASVKNSARLAEIEGRIAAKDLAIQQLERKVEEQAKELAEIKAKLGE